MVCDGLIVELFVEGTRYGGVAGSHRKGVVRTRRCARASKKAAEREHAFLAVDRSKGAHGSKTKLCFSCWKFLERFIVSDVIKFVCLEAKHVLTKIGNINHKHSRRVSYPTSQRAISIL